MGEQSESAIRGIVLLVSVLPAAALLIGVGILFLYRLDDRFVNQIEQDLSERRSETC
jgi:Na+/melibiose symporter-like transporter